MVYQSVSAVCRFQRPGKPAGVLDVCIVQPAVRNGMGACRRIVNGATRRFFQSGEQAAVHVQTDSDLLRRDGCSGHGGRCTPPARHGSQRLVDARQSYSFCRRHLVNSIDVLGRQCGR